MDETQTVAQAYPRVWAYLGLKNLLMRYEVDNGTEDAYTSVALQFGAAEKAH